MNRDNKKDIPSEEENNIDQIREILFGKNVKSLEKRISDMEEHINNETTSMREENNRLFATLEKYVKKQSDSLVEQFSLEKDGSREERLKLTESIRTLGEKINVLKEESIKRQRENREQLLEMSNEIGNNLMKQKEELSQLIKKKNDSLDERKVDSAKLGELFSELVLKLDEKEEE